MAKMIPGGAPDQSAFFLSRQAASNEALVRLYASLLAKIDDREREHEFKREMFEKGSQAQRDLLDQRMSYGVDPNPDGPDGARVKGGAHADPPDDRPAPPPARLPQPNSTQLPGVNTAPSADKFSSNEAPNGVGINLSDEARNAMAQAPTDFNRNLKPTRSMSRSPSALPGPARGKNARSAGFVEGLDQGIIDHFEQTEAKYGLPRHTLLTIFGQENAGGRDAQRKGSVEGWFKFHDALAKEYALKPGDRQDIYKMADITAQNLIRNNMELKRINGGKGLSADPQDIPRWGILHQFGHSDGPLLLVGQQLNPELPATAAMKQRKDPSVNYKILVGNGLDPTASVGKLVSQQAGYYTPWTNEAYKLAGDRPVKTRPTATTNTGVPSTAVEQNVNDGNVPPLMQRAPVTPKPQSAIPGSDAYAQGGDAGSEAPFGRGTTSQQPRIRFDTSVIHNQSRVNPRLVAAVTGGAELALPDGYTLRATSGHRPNQRGGSYHKTGNATDWEIIKPNGERIENRGPDHTGLYTRLARGVKTWVRENDPDAERHIGYGGAFETSSGSRTADTMHYDWGGSRGRLRPEVQFARLQPLQQHERNAPSKVQVAGPLPAKEAPQRPPPAKGQSRTENYLYEPLGRPLKPSEQFTPKGQLSPTHFAPPQPSIAEFNPLSTSADAFKPTAAAAMREGITPPSKPAILGRSGGPTFDTPMPQPRPDTESGDLEYGSPSQPLPPDPNFADSADSTLLNVLPKPSPDPHVAPDKPLDIPQDMGPDEAKNVPDAPWLAPDERLNVPIEAIPDIAPDESKNVPDDGLSALSLPMPLNNASTTTQPDVPDIQYPDAAGANASEVGGPDVSALQSQPQPLPPTAPTSGWQARRAYNANTPRRLPWTAIKEDVPAALGGIKDAIFAIPGAIKGAGSHIAGNASMLRQDVGSGAGAVADTAQDVAGVAGNVAGAYNTMQNNRQQTLEELGAAIRDRYTAYKDAVNSNVPTIDATRRPSLAPQAPNATYRGSLPPQPNPLTDADVAPTSAADLKKRISDAIFTNKDATPDYRLPPADYAGSWEKIKEWVNKKMESSPTTTTTTTTATPPAPNKPTASAKPPIPAAPANPNVFVPPKMMPDGVTPWLANEAGAPKVGPLHHIKPKKKAPEDLLDVTGQPPAAAGSTPTDIPPAPGTRPVIPNADVGVKMMPSGRFKATLEPVPVDDIAPVEPE